MSSRGGHGSNRSFSEDPRLRIGAEERHICSFCNKSFPSLQSLGGHQTRHRREIEVMRRQHEAFMEGQRLSLVPPPTPASAGSLGVGGRATDRGSRQSDRGRTDTAARGFVPMLPLAPNCDYWEAFRGAEQPPRLVDFIGVSDRGAVEQPHRVVEVDRSSEETITEPWMRAARQVEGGEEVESESVDLTLKL